VLVIGVDGVRFDLLGPDTTPSIWAFGQAGFLAPVAPLVLAALGDPGRGDPGPRDPARDYRG
jgi:hypothetical protein